MDSCEYPVDAAGKRIPLDTRVLYDDQGVAHAINYFLYATHSMDPEGHWMVTTGEGKRIQAHYLYLTAPDSLGKLIDDIEKCARTGNSCRYFSPTGNCRDCAIRSDSDYNCERAVAVLTAMGYEVVNTYFTDEWYSDAAMGKRGVVQVPLCYLAKSLENMSLCHAAYFVKGWEDARGCRIEHEAAEAYGLEVIHE